MRLVQKSFNFLYFHTLKNETHYTNGFLIADYTWVPSDPLSRTAGLRGAPAGSWGSRGQWLIRMQTHAALGAGGPPSGLKLGRMASVSVCTDVKCGGPEQPRGRAGPQPRGRARAQTPGSGQVAVRVLLPVHSLQILLLDQNVDAFLGAGSEEGEAVKGKKNTLTVGTGTGPPSPPGRGAV